MTALFVTCTNAACLHSKPFTFDALGLADDLQFPSIARLGAFVCTLRPPGGERDAGLARASRI